METWDETGIRTLVVEEIRQLADQYKINRVILFGSRARGDFRRASDIDLAVSGGDASLFHLALEEEASTLLQFDVVDLDKEIQPGLREIIKEAYKYYNCIKESIIDRYGEQLEKMK